MTITQMVEIPASHRIILDVPPEFPVGKTILTFTPASAVLPAAEAEARDVELINRNAELAKKRAAFTRLTKYHKSLPANFDYEKELADYRDVELINRNAEQLNREALEVLSFQNLEL